MNFRVILLYPFALLYTIITRFRNHLYNIGYSRSFNYDIMTINVGNLSVGGTGKTPMVEYLINALISKYSMATLSRGYKRKSKGFIIADKSSTANDIGDEPYQFHSKFANVTVAVGENRSLAIPRILMEHPETQVIILDDAYQHRTVSPDLNIMLTQFNDPFYEDFVMPSGNLREVRKGAARADAIIITKCADDLQLNAANQVVKRVKKYANPEAPVFFTSINYGMPIPFVGGHQFSGKVILFAGLGNINPLIEYVSNSFEMIEVVSFKDHYDYTRKDIDELIQKAKASGAQLMTTEKDMAKIRSNNLFDAKEQVELYYLPISVQFLFDQGSTFNSFVADAIKSKYEQEDGEVGN